jgi:hypothetical protein
MAKTAIKNRRLYKAEWEEMSEGWLAQTPVSSAAPPTPPRFLTAKERKDAGLPPMGKPTPKLEWPKNLTREELAVQRAQEEAAAAERRTAEAARLTSDSPNVTEPAEDVTGEPHASTCGDELSIIADDADKEVVDDIVDGDDDPETNPPQRRGRPSRTSAELAEGTDGDSSVDIDDDEGDGPIVDPLGLPDEVTPEDTKGRQTTIECGARR